MRYHLLSYLACLGTSCAATAPATKVEHPPLQGRPLDEDTRVAPRIEQVLLPGKAASVPGSWGAAVSPLVVARNAADLARAGVTPAVPVDFSRWLVLVPSGEAAPPTRAAVLTSSETDHEVQLWRVTDDEVQVRYITPCRFCGGAAYLPEQARQCSASLKPRVYRVPRPALRLVVGVEDPSCDPAAP
ncbi:MAG: hypothetical protein HY901_12260 [Deltaproteobacteria bacterium]|nr:hypothetical protein [Deltaproteobacteria bacterium]